ncbi:MAG TPA: RMD1 family protein [Holophaga sp.]|nr:RMD1 family protein [Holophaga sp.]
MTAPSSIPLDPAASHCTLVADCFEGQIDLRAFRARYPHHRVLCANPLVLEPEAGRWIFLEKFGAVVFWNPTEALLDELQADLQGLEGVGPRVDRIRDELRVVLGAPADHVGFNEVQLRELTLDRLKIVSLALAQSVALEYFEGTVREALARVQPVVHALRARGRLELRHREALKLVGFAMEVRAAVLENLTLFDDPPETWESEALARLDGALYDTFDLEERLAALQQKIDYLADAGARVLDLLATRKDQRLEWIIIILILVEVLHMAWTELGSRLFS